MIHLHTLGDALITVGEKEIRPSSPMVFAALLYLGVERGRRVPRAALQELLFPESDERSGSHSVRQLLYKLRQLGAAVRADGYSVALYEDVADDTSAASLVSASIASLRSGYLPAYAPQISEALSGWVETTRDQQTTRLVRALLNRLKKQYDAGGLDEALEISDAVLHHDPLNEEATLTRAKILAIGGHKAKAIQVLADYSEEVGLDLRLPAERLSRRIQDRAMQGDMDLPLIGRELELRSILAQHSRAAGGQAAVTVIWGEPGIGKTRLAQEVAERRRLEGDRVFWAHCQPHTIGRPMGVLTDLLPGLMKCRGSLGVSPRSMDWLRRLEVRSERGGFFEGDLIAVEASRHVMLAMRDLVASIASESGILLVLEDVQWIDAASREFLLRYLPPDSRLHVLMTSREGSLATDNSHSATAVWAWRLERLSFKESAELLDAFLASVKTVGGTLRQTCVELANGSPLFIRALAQHLAANGDMPNATTGIGDLMLQRVHSLQPASLLLLRLISILGTLSTHERLRKCVSLDSFALMLAIQELADGGLVVRRDGSLTCVHQVLSETVLSHAPDPIRAELFLVAAGALENEGQVTRQASLLWACAEYWCLGGQPDRASNALQECAAYAIELGQPRYAIPALERAQEFCSRQDLVSLLEATIRVADDATDDAAILRNTEVYRRICQQSVVDKTLRFVDLAEARALRRLGSDIWPRRADLLRDAMSDDMPMKDRRRAARTYVVSAEESFGGADAAKELPSLAPLWRDDTDLDAVELKMVVNLTLGDVEAAVPAARTLLARIEEYPLLTRPTTLSGIARTLFVAGMVDESVAVSRREFELATQLGSPSDIAMAAARLTDFFITVGDVATARKWANTTEAHIASSSFARAYHLCNSVTVAIAESHFVRAQELLTGLKLLDEAKKKHAIRSIAGLEMILANARGSLQIEPFNLEELRRLDDAAWQHGEHLFFAIGLFLLLISKGMKQEAQVRLREYFVRRRRERYDPWTAIVPMHITDSQLRQLKLVTDQNVFQVVQVRDASVQTSSKVSLGELGKYSNCGG